MPISAAAAAVLAVAIVAASLAAQSPHTNEAPSSGSAQAPQAGGPGGPPREFPKPTNLKVLPKNLTGKQVRDIMEGWSGALGVHCNACHTADPTRKGPNGRPAMNFPDDSQHEKETARLMFKMTNKINDDYISMVEMDHDDDAGHEAHHEDHADHKVTCGTCHRGHQHPEAYIPPKEHDGPPPPAGQPPLPR